MSAKILEVRCSYCERQAIQRADAGSAPAVPTCNRHRADGAPTRDAIRSARKREVRARSIDVSRMTKRERDLAALMEASAEEFAPIANIQRPKTRGDCVGAARPCPYVACKWHLFLDVSPRTGSIKLNYPDLEPDQLARSCALDVADEGGTTLERVGEIANITRERVRQVENKAVAHLKALPEFRRLNVLMAEDFRQFYPPREPEEPFMEEEANAPPADKSGASKSERAPRPIRAQLPRAILGKDYVTICVSTYPRELAKLDALVDEFKRSGDRKMSRSALIRLAIDKLAAERAATTGGPDAAE